MSTRAYIEKQPPEKHSVTVKMSATVLNDTSLEITTSAGYGKGVQRPYIWGVVPRPTGGGK